MPWVLWDIVFPLIVTFAIGLATGWLLWRWRRQLPQKTIETASVDDQTDLAAASATILIEERDAALARAEVAEQQAARLTAELDNVAVGTTDDSAANDSELDAVDSAVQQQVEQLEQALASERASKAELEQAFMDLTNSHAVLSQKFDDANDEENAELDAATAFLQSQHDDAQQQLQESQLKLQSVIEQHQQHTETLENKLQEKQSLVEQLQVEQKNTLIELQAIKQMQTDEDKPSASSNVHQLSSYTRTDVPNNDSHSVPESDALSRTAINTTSDARVARGVGLNAATSAAAVTAADSDALREEEAINENAVTKNSTVPVESTTDTDDSHSAGLADAESSVSKEKEDTPTRSVTSKKTTANGYSPNAWQVPERTPGKEERDNLQQIKGIGPVLENILHKTGIYYFKQVALLDDKGVEELDTQLPQFSGRIQRDEWVQQAKTLHQKKYGEVAG